jgi:hypothetical protein
MAEKKRNGRGRVRNVPDGYQIPVRRTPLVPGRLTLQHFADGSVQRCYHGVPALERTPEDVNERALDAIETLIQLVIVPTKDSTEPEQDLLEVLFHDLRRRMIDASAEASVRTTAINISDVAGTLADFIARQNEGVRVPRPRAKALARLLRLVEVGEDVHRAALDRISSQADKALGARDIGGRFGRAEAVRRIEGYFVQALSTANTDPRGAAKEMAWRFYEQHDHAWERDAVFSLEKKLARALALGESDVDKLISLCARHAGIKARLHSFANDKRARASSAPSPQPKRRRAVGE